MKFTFKRRKADNRQNCTQRSQHFLKSYFKQLFKTCIIGRRLKKFRVSDNYYIYYFRDHCFNKCEVEGLYQ